MVVCQNCRKREAKRQTAVNIDGRTVYMALCDKCFNELQRKSQGTSALNQFSKDLTELAKNDKLDPVIGRDSEIDRLIHILSRRTKNNPVLIGEPGVGKTAIVEGLAQKIVDKMVPEPLREKRLVVLDLAAMLAGTIHRGAFEKRLKEVIEEVIRTKGQIILFVDELHTIIGAGSAQGSMDAANILKPYLARGELQLIGATTTKEYRIVEGDAALERRFQQVFVEEPSVKHTIQILQGLRSRYEDHHKIKISQQAIEAAVKLSIRYISDKYLPDKAIDLIDEAGAALRLQLSAKEPNNLKQVAKQIESLQKKISKTDKVEKRKSLEGKLESLKIVKDELTDLWIQTKLEDVPTLKEVHVAAVVSTATGIPLSELTQNEREKLKNLDRELEKIVIGQEDAIRVISQSIKRARAGVKPLDKPIGVFMFLGLTGVGKTQLAKALAQVLYGSADFLIRIDMTEYNERHNVSRLLGSPPGYVGYDEGGQLTERVRRRPFSVILFDEIEKAHPEVFNTLLQAFDDGRLTDGHGRTVDFRNTIIIMTSNVGSEFLRKEKIGFTELEKDKLNVNEVSEAYERITERLHESLKSKFKPEFLNRIDDIIIFRPLDFKAIRKIVDIEIAQLKELLAENNIKIKLTKKAKDYLVSKGYNIELGARPLRRLIQKEVENAISELIIDNVAKVGFTIVVDEQNGEIVVKVEQKSKVSVAA